MKLLGNASLLRKPPVICRRAGFTLIEIILALSIALGLLVVALYFYSQTANLRGQLLDETDRLAALRLVMNRITSELRSALEVPQHPFVGEMSRVSFVTVAAPMRLTTRFDTNAPVSAPLSDLRWVSYGLGRSGDGTNETVTGLYGTTQANLDPPRGRSAATSTLSPDTTNSIAYGPAPITEVIRLFRLRYWDGSAWVAQWSSRKLPAGVEVTLGFDPLPDEALLTEYTSDLFRRVIRISGGQERTVESEAFDSDSAAAGSPLPKP